MTDQPGAAQAQLEALTKSAHHLSQLKMQLDQAQKQHALLLNQALDAAERDPSHAAFGIVRNNKTVAEGPLSKPMIEMLRAIAGGGSYRLAKAPAVRTKSGAPTSGSLGTHASTCARRYNSAAEFGRLRGEGKCSIR